jgi:catechol 2,3-dioxygenase-like lactoylglutathione lyase family enzyme
MVALGIEMQDPAAARAFYTEKMDFAPGSGYQKEQIWLKLPGSSNQQVELIQHASGTAFEYYFSVASVRRTAAQLKSLQIPIEKRGAMLSIQDPDGNRILFVKARSN